MSEEARLRRKIALVCARLYDRGLIAGQDGNVSVRLDARRLLVTPAGLTKVDVTPDSLLVLSLDGAIVERARLDVSLRPTTEIGMHLRIYARRPDVRAVVHAHPPVATGFAVAGEDFLAGVLPEIIFQMGGVPLVPYATPGTPAVAEVLDPYLDRYDGYLLASHGATTVGPTLTVAHQRMESLEHAARIIFTARRLGRVNELSAVQANELSAARAATGVAPSAAPSRGGAVGPASSTARGGRSA